MNKLLVFVPRLTRGAAKLLSESTDALVAANEDVLLGRWSSRLATDSTFQTPLECIRHVCETEESRCVVTDIRALFFDVRLKSHNIEGSTYNGWTILSVLPLCKETWCEALFGSYQFKRDRELLHVRNAIVQYEDILQVHGANPGLGFVLKGEFVWPEVVSAIQTSQKVCDTYQSSLPSCHI